MEPSATKRHLPTGFTLVEIMVAMVIALIVMGGVYRTLVDEDVNQERSEKILDMQNNARVALERIARDVRRTGSLGCGGVLSASTIANSVTTPTAFIAAYTNGAWGADMPIVKSLTLAAGGGANINFLSEVMGFDDNSAGGIGRAGTDVLTLVYLNGEQELNGAMATMIADVPVLFPERFDNNDLLYVTDCVNYSLFQKTGHTGVGVQHGISGQNVTDNLGKLYSTDPVARLSRLNTATYYISNDTNFELRYNGTSLNPALKVGAIADNIEDLQFEFLADENENNDLNDDPWRPNLAAYTAAMPVRAMRIWVLAMSSPDYGFDDKETYDYPGSPYFTPSPNTDPNTCYKDSNGNCKPSNPFNSLNGAGGSPFANAPIATPLDDQHRHHYLATAVVFLRNAGL